MTCEHPRLSWVGMADGIHCGLCGQLIDLSEKPKKAPEPVVDPEPVKPGPEPTKEAPAEEKTKKAPKKGGRK